VISVRWTEEELNEEQWSPVVNYEGYYSVSTLGRVWSHARGSRAVVWGIGRLLRPYLCKGYRRVNLSKNGVIQIRSVHTLVAEAFLPKPETESLLEVNHKNFDKQDNRVTNLEWLTSQQHKKHTAAGGRTSRGRQHHSNKISEADVRAIRQRFKAGEKPTAISRDYPVGRATVSNICHRRIWKWLPDDPDEPT
jgi:hypothetical protein